MVFSGEGVGLWCLAERESWCCFGGEGEVVWCLSQKEGCCSV